MKCRSGFVSNSSSSSFIIPLEEKPGSIEETAEILFGTTDGTFIGYSGPVDYITLAERVYWDIRNARPLTKDDLADVPVMNEDLILTINEEELDRLSRQKDDRKYWKKIEEHYQKRAKFRTKYWEQYVSRENHPWYGDVRLYSIGYSDDTILGSTLEHHRILEKAFEGCFRVSEH
jgi:hypothetical protein